MKPLTPGGWRHIVGKKALPRTKSSARCGLYQEHNLQDPANKRMINADDKLAKVFEKPGVDVRSGQTDRQTRQITTRPAPWASPAPTAAQAVSTHCLRHVAAFPFLPFAVRAGA